MARYDKFLTLISADLPDSKISDLYNHNNVESLRCFYDYYTKDINNGWNFTPTVRLSVLGTGGRDIVNRPETNYPLTREKPFKLFLNGNSGMMEPHASQELCTRAYLATTGSLIFTYKIPSKMEFVGPSRLRLFLEADGSDDMDIFVTLKKYNAEGELQKSMVIDVGWLADDPEKERCDLITINQQDPEFCSSYFSSGPLGSLRVSHRGLDEDHSTEFQPAYTHKEEQLLKAKEVTAADLEIWPYGWIFDAGEVMRLTISGFNPHPHLRPNDPRPKSRNKGQHIVHTGGATASYLLLPLTS